MALTHLSRKEYVDPLRCRVVAWSWFHVSHFGNGELRGPCQGMQARSPLLFFTEVVVPLALGSWSIG